MIGRLSCSGSDASSSDPIDAERVTKREDQRSQEAVNAVLQTRYVLADKGRFRFSGRGVPVTTPSSAVAGLCEAGPAASPPQDSSGSGGTPTLRDWPGSAGRRLTNAARTAAILAAEVNRWTNGRKSASRRRCRPRLSSGSRADSEGGRGFSCLTCECPPMFLRTDDRRELCGDSWRARSKTSALSRRRAWLRGGSGGATGSRSRA